MADSTPRTPATPKPHKPTPIQRTILTALAGGPLTSKQLQTQVIPTVTDRALELRLKRLAGYGWVRAEIQTQPGSRQPRQYWHLQPTGARAINVACPPRLPHPLDTRPPTRRPPTPDQCAVLELLTEFTSLTTGQIGEYLSANISRRALQLRLTGLRERGWIAETRIQPERGAASIRAWKLLPAGGKALGQPDLVPPPLPAAGVRSMVLPTDPTLPLPAHGQEILGLLAHWKALTTEQIARHVWGQWPCTGAMQAVFEELAARHLIRDQDLAPERGENSPHYWQLLTGGAAEIGIIYGSQHRKRPTQATIAHRGVLLELIRQVAAAGWSLIAPHIARPRDPLVEDSPQAQRLTEAILDHIGRDLAARLAAGESRQRLAEEIHRHQAGQIGAILPRYVNDWVAYQPADVTRTVLLIPHPPAAGLGFWQNKPDLARRPDDPPRRESRLERYRRLSAILPVIAIFPDRDTAAPYIPILEPGGFAWAVVEEITTRLNHLQRA